MRNAIAGVVGLSLGLALAGCGEGKGGGGGLYGGGGGVTGTWTLDTAKVKAAVRDAQKSTMAEVPPEMKPMIDKMLEAFDQMNVEITFNSDGTYSGSSATPNPMTGAVTKNAATGTWKQSGDEIVVTPKTEDGKAVSGDEAKQMTLVLKDGMLSQKGSDDGDGPPLFLKRK